MAETRNKDDFVFVVDWGEVVAEPANDPRAFADRGEKEQERQRAEDSRLKTEREQVRLQLERSRLEAERLATENARRRLEAELREAQEAREKQAAAECERLAAAERMRTEAEETWQREAVARTAEEAARIQREEQERQSAVRVAEEARQQAAELKRQQDSERKVARLAAEQARTTEEAARLAKPHVVSQPEPSSPWGGISATPPPISTPLPKPSRPLLSALFDPLAEVTLAPADSAAAVTGSAPIPRLFEAPSEAVPAPAITLSPEPPQKRVSLLGPAFQQAQMDFDINGQPRELFTELPPPKADETPTRERRD